MIVGDVVICGGEGPAQLAWAIVPEESDQDPSIQFDLFESGTFRRAHRCITCDVVTIECAVLKCGYCGRMVPATTTTCTCGWTLGETEWGDT